MKSSEISRRTLLGGAVSASALLVSGSGMAQSAAKVPVTIANASGSMTRTMQAMLVQKGYLEEFGLAPNLMHVADGSRILSGILAGQIDLSTMSGFGQVFPAVSKGGKLKVLGAGAALPTLGVFTSKPDIKTLKDLEGRVVGTGSVGALLHQLMVALLRKHKVDVSKVRFVNIGSSVDVFRAVVAGTVDAGPGEITVLDEPGQFKVTLLENGNMSLELTEFTYQGAWTSDKIIAEKRDVLVKAMAAHAKLYRYVQTPGSEQDYLKARKAAFPSAKQEEGIAQWKYIQKYKPFAENLAVDEAHITFMQELNVSVKVQDKVLPYAQVADMSIARDAIALLKKHA
jgi:ABC-type nitrate/sulfonate/bicarbonate transport system substrate-binding protein